MINWNITKKVIGLDKRYFDKYPSSSKKILAICDTCGKERWLSYTDYNNFCQSCGTKTEKNRNSHSDIMLKRYEDPEERKKTGEAVKNSIKYQKNVKSKEFSLRMSNRQAKRYEDPEERKKTSEAVKNSKNERKIAVFKSKICINCGEIFIPNCGTHIYCEKCNKESYCYKFNPECKKSNREKYDNECFICGLSEEENITSTGRKLKLSVHHIDMNKNQGCDDIDWKLVPVCLHCHNKLHNELWRDRILYILTLMKE